MKVASAGQYFRITNGGAPMNSNDALIAWARKDMMLRATEMRKEKAIYAHFGTVSRSAVSLLETPKTSLRNWKKWTVSQLRTMITWKQGPTPLSPNDDKLSNLNKGALQMLWEMKYAPLPDPLLVDESWTAEKEEELARLEAGRIKDFIVETGLQRAMDRDDEEITIRLKAVSDADRKTKIIIEGFKSLPKQQRQDVAIQLALLIDDDEEVDVAADTDGNCSDGNGSDDNSSLVSDSEECSSNDESQ